MKSIQSKSWPQVAIAFTDVDLRSGSDEVEMFGQCDFNAVTAVSAAGSAKQMEGKEHDSGRVLCSACSKCR